MPNQINDSKTTTSLLFQEESYQIIGACIAVHKKLGHGFECSVYEEALQREMLKNEIPFQKHQHLPLYYDGQALQKEFIADFVCFDKVILDIRVMKSLDKEGQQQVVNHLKATQFELGLLINFGESNLTWKRLIHTA